MTTALVAPVTCRVGRDQLLLLVHSPDSSLALQQLDEVLRGEGYEKEKDAPDDMLYGRGSKGGRILIGGLSERQAFQVVTDQDGDLTLVTLKGTASVVTAGAIGISKMRKELARLNSLIMLRFAPSPSWQGTSPDRMGRFAPTMTRGQVGRTGEYLLVIILVLTLAVVAGMVALWAVIK